MSKRLFWTTKGPSSYVILQRTKDLNQCSSHIGAYLGSCTHDRDSLLSERYQVDHLCRKEHFDRNGFERSIQSEKFKGYHLNISNWIWTINTDPKRGEMPVNETKCAWEDISMSKRVVKCQLTKQSVLGKISRCQSWVNAS